jgi:hypothetical protein
MNNKLAPIKRPTMTFQLNTQVKNMVDALVMDWIHLHFDEISATIKGNRYTIADEDDRQEVIIFELFILNSVRNFGEFCKTSNKVDVSCLDEIVEYCNNYLEDTYGHGEQFHLELDKINDLSYLCKNLGYAFGTEYKSEITEWFDSMDAPFLK